MAHEKIIETLFFLSAFLSCVITFSILGFLLIPGLPLFWEGNFFAILTQPWAPDSNQFGIYPMIAGTIAISLLTIMFAFPLSLGCAALISLEDKNKPGRFMRKIVEIMTGVPTVIYGFVGIFLLVPLMRDFFHAGSGMCVLTAALMLTILVSPTMILLFCDSFAQVPKSYGDAIMAMGGTQIQKFLYITLPNSKSGIITGITLALGRVMGDTLIALMIAGNAVQVPGSPLDSARALTSHIALVFASDYNSPEFKAIFACGIFLYLFSSIIALIVNFTRNRG
jgi:phosphate transport system permease protein